MTVITFPSPSPSTESAESADMSEKQSPPLSIVDLGTDENVGDIAVLIREHGPLTLAKLARHVWTNTNHQITKDDRVQLHEFLKQHAPAGGWENPKGNTWQIVGHVAEPKGAPLQQYIPGTEPEVDEHVEPLAREYVALREEASDRATARDEANVVMKTAMKTRKMTNYEFIDDAGDKVTVTVTETSRTTVARSKTDESD